jgi:hypothetical protein
MWDVGCGMWGCCGVGMRDVGCGMWDVGCGLGISGMWDGAGIDVGWALVAVYRSTKVCNVIDTHGVNNMFQHL